MNYPVDNIVHDLLLLGLSKAIANQLIQNVKRLGADQNLPDVRKVREP
jgi:hypothetical protein